MRVAALAAVVVLASCGSRSGLDEPSQCERAEDCPEPEDFCTARAACIAGACAIEPAPSCDDRDRCTLDRCDAVARACVHAPIDLDADGHVDVSCGGDDCADDDRAVSPDVRETCANRVDDDCDRRTDCSDSDCARDPECAMCAPEVCRGGADEDCDFVLDCADSDCAEDPICCAAREATCDDALDDDCDGLRDCSDPDCASSRACCAPSVEQCNGLDDDCDGAIDDGARCFFLDERPIAAVSTDRCGEDWYSYDDPDRASAHPSPDIRRDDRVAIAVVASPAACGPAPFETVYVAVIADRAGSGDGGELTLDFVVDPPVRRAIEVSDEPNECSYSAPLGSGGCRFRWQPCCTDGTLLGPFIDDFCVELVLGEPDGLDGVDVVDGAATITAAFDRPITICSRTAPEVR